MKILILIIITKWSFGQPHPQYIIVSSPEMASIRAYDNELRTKSMCEPDLYEYRLYEVDLKNKEVKQIDIPKISIGGCNANGKE